MRLACAVPVAVTFALLAPSLASAGKSDLRVAPADTFLLGGEQTTPLDVSGRNIGATHVIIAAQRGTAETVIADVPPGGQFAHQFAPGEVAAIRNPSATVPARVDVRFPDSAFGLSMRYVLPQSQ